MSPPTDKVDPITTGDAALAAAGSGKDLQDALDLVYRVRSATVNGEALAHILAYRNVVRSDALETKGIPSDMLLVNKAEFDKLVTPSADRPIEQQLDGGTHWEWPVNTIGRFVENLKAYPQETPLHTAYFVEIGDQRIAKTTHPSVSRETVYEGRIQKFDAARQSIVIWATAAPVAPNSSERSPIQMVLHCPPGATK